MNPWKEAVIDSLVVNCIYNESRHNDPVTALSDLIRVEVQMALDPEISEAAQKLIERGRASK